MPDPDRPPSLEALPGYESVTLFEERARAAVPDFAVTDDNRETVVRICHRLDGLPLPIELAAARLRALSLDQILERLTDRYRILTAGSRVAPTRQQTLRLSVDWSYDLCTREEQRLWARLSVFSGGFELDAVESICADRGGAGNMVDLVASLVDKSILTVEKSAAGVRYGMLETLRDYGQEKLEESACAGSVGRGTGTGTSDSPRVRTRIGWPRAAGADRSTDPGAGEPARRPRIRRDRARLGRVRGADGERPVPLLVLPRDARRGTALVRTGARRV
ncbi:hypothetical protein GS571_14225 [Rhodococcus hoagii]|nr:hypothetical protein [Prescottella equi]